MEDMNFEFGISKWKELAISNDRENYITIIGRLREAGIPYREKGQYIGHGTRRGGTISALGENQRYTYLYQVFVKKNDLEKAKFICKKK